MRATLALAMLLGFVALPAAAADTGEFVVNSSPITETRHPDASMSGRSGGALVVWSDGFDIRARRFDRAGNPLEDDFQVAETTLEYLGPLSGTVDPLGFSVVWSEFTNRFPGNSFFRRFGRDAEPLAQRGFDIEAANVDSDRRGDSVLVGVTPSAGVAGWRFSAEGRQIGRRFRVADRGLRPQVTVDARGSFAVLWLNEDGIFLRRFQPDGSPSGPPLQVTARGSDPRLAGNDSGALVVTWRSDRGILARVYQPSGPRKTVTVTSQRSIEPDSVAMDAAGRFLVTWSCCFGQPASQIFGRFFDLPGVPLAPSFQVSEETGVQDNLSSAAAGPAGHFLVVWKRELAGGDEVIGRYLEPGGS